MWGHGLTSNWTFATSWRCRISIPERGRKTEVGTVLTALTLLSALFGSPKTWCTPTWGFFSFEEGTAEEVTWFLLASSNTSASKDMLKLLSNKNNNSLNIISWHLKSSSQFFCLHRKIIHILINIKNLRHYWLRKAYWPLTRIWMYNLFSYTWRF